MKLASKPNEAQQSSKEKQRNEQWVKETELPTQPGACGRGNAKEQVTHTRQWQVTTQTFWRTEGHSGRRAKAT